MVRIHHDIMHGMDKRAENIKLIVCDIDNTIIPTGREEITGRLRADFHKAIEKGIYVMIDTGRHYTFLQKSLFEDLPMDYIGTINGACLVRRDGTVISKQAMSEDTMHRMTASALENHIGLGFKFVDSIVTYAYHDQFVKGYCANDYYASLVKNDCEHRKHHLEWGMPLGTFLIGADEDVSKMKDDVPEMTFAWSSKHGYDAFMADITKATAVEPVLEMLGIGWENVIAFGDAGNDTPFIEKAGIGVALGNARDDVQKHADYVADTCANDGVAKMLEELGIV